jgi:capsular exopolysaccharide synthesis family protein
MRPPQGPAAGGMGMTPKEIAGILRRHIWMIIIFTVLGTMIGGGSWFLCDRYIPRYTSKRAIDVAPPIEKDVTKIGGVQPQKDIYYQFRFTKSALIKQQSMLEELLRQPKVRDTDWFKRYAKVDSEGKLIGDQDKAINKAYEKLEDNLGASAPRDNNFLLVSMSCGSAKEAKLIVDEMVRIFLRQQQELAQSGLKGELAQFKDQRDKIQSKLNQIESGLESIRSGTRFARLNLGENQSFRDYMDEKLADLETRNSEFDSEKGRLESIIASLKVRAEATTPDERAQEQVESDPIARQMRTNISLLEPQLERRLDRFGEDHRLVRETQASLNQMREAYAKRQYEIRHIQTRSNLLAAEESMAALVQQLETTTQQLQSAHAEYKEIDRIRNEYSRYERQRVESRTLLEEMNTLLAKKTAQHDDPGLSKLSSPYAATNPREKSFPNKMMFFPGGLILGLMAGLGLAFLVELMNDLLRSPSDVMRHLKVPLMGMVCHIDDDEDIDGVDLYHVVRQAPYSIMSECYRQLRTNLKLSGAEGQAKKTLLITSGQAGDGKTTVAVNLTSTLLAEDSRVLLIDANFRRPSTPRLFPHSAADGSAIDTSDYGLSNYLMGQCDSADQIVRESDIGGLFIIDSGPLPANPAQLFSSQRMKLLLEHCKSNFDYVIIDGPAMLVSDSKTLAAQVDGTIIVFNTANTHRGAAMRMLREMREIHADIVGTVLMGVKSRKGGYFQEIYRSYQDYQRVHVEQPA